MFYGFVLWLVHRETEWGSSCLISVYKCHCVLFCYVESTPTLSLSLFMYEFSRKFSLVFTTACLYLCSILYVWASSMKAVQWKKSQMGDRVGSNSHWEAGGKTHKSPEGTTQTLIKNSLLCLYLWMHTNQYVCLGERCRCAFASLRSHPHNFLFFIFYCALDCFSVGSGWYRDYLASALWQK